MNNVYLNFNNKKGIYALSFYNPILKKRSTRSLGIGVGTDESKAKLLQEEVYGIINNSDFHNYDGYEKAKERFSEEAVKAVYDKTKLKKEEFRKQIQSFIEENIKVENNEGFVEKAVVFIGNPGVGKTKVIQQKIGSVKYNTPASTVSNTTTGSFVADIDNKANKLELLFQEIDDVQETNNIKGNIYSLLRYIMTSEGQEISENEILNKLIISNDLRFNLTYLISDKNEFFEIAKQIKNEFKSICYKFKSNDKDELAKIIEDIILILDGSNEDECDYKFSENELKEINSFLLDNYIQAVQNLINKEKIKILKSILRVCRKLAQEIPNIVINIKYVDSKEEERKVEYNEQDKFIDISDKILINIKTFYISIQYSLGEPDESLREKFFSIMQKVSCVDAEIKSILPLVEKLKIKGNFKSSVGNEENNNKYLLVDSEGIGHNAGNLENSNYFIKDLHNANKIVWMLDITRPIDKTIKDTLNLLSSNGSLYKTVIAFTKCDYVLETNESIEQRIYKLKENLQKEFNGNSDVINSRIMNISNMIILGDMDKIIRDGKVFIKYRGKEIKDDINVDFVKNFNQLDDFKEFKIKESINLNYSLIYLAKIIDDSIYKFINKFKKEVYRLHWKRVEAFTNRIGYNYNPRSYYTLMPEADLKKMLKMSIEYIISNPTNYSKKQKEESYEYFQMIQEEIAKELDKIIEKLLFKNNQEKWKELYSLNGYGSGNKRKCETVNLVDESISFNRSINKENEILKQMVYVLRKLNEKKGFNGITINVNDFI